MSETDNITPELISKLKSEIIMKLKTVYGGQVIHNLDFGYRLAVEEIVRDSCGNVVSKVARDIDGSNEWGLHMIFDDIVYNPCNYRFLISYRHSKWKGIQMEELNILYAQVKEVLSLVEKHKEDNRRRINNE